MDCFFDPREKERKGQRETKKMYNRNHKLDQKKTPNLVSCSQHITAYLPPPLPPSHQESATGLNPVKGSNEEPFIKRRDLRRERAKPQSITPFKSCSSLLPRFLLPFPLSLPPRIFQQK